MSHAPTSWTSVKRVYEVTSTPLVVTHVFTREVLDTVSGLSVELFPPRVKSHLTTGSRNASGLIDEGVSWLVTA